QHRDREVVDLGGLGRARDGEAREQRALAHDGGLRLALGEAQRPLGELQRVEFGQATPTWTSRKRAGAAPWETTMTCPGSPLPQLVRPHSRHSSGPQTASRLPQKRGGPPGEGPLRYSPPSSPPRISRHTSVANWNCRRRSSIDHERLLSR